jgi:glycosyltransferase involved in cell wall biosynthesis
MNLTLAITNYNRTDLLKRSFEKVINDDRVYEILIMDDNSTQEVWNEISEYSDCYNKVLCFRNKYNIGMSLNKRKAINYSNSDWVLLLDSDNIIDSSYLDALEKFTDWELHTDTIYCPVKALPNFDYSFYSGIYISKDNIDYFSTKPLFEALMNTCNYVVNRKTYLKNFVENHEIKGVDTFWYAYNHLKNGGNFYIVPNMQYHHEVHSGSQWLANADYNTKSSKEILNLVQNLNNA